MDFAALALAPAGLALPAPAPVPPELSLPTTTMMTSMFHGFSGHPVVDPTLFSFLLLLGLFNFFLFRILIQHLRERAATGGNPCHPKASGPRALAKSSVLPYVDAAAEGLGTDCTVCLEDFGEDELVRVLHSCHHTFHRDCIDAWLIEHATCPNCRADLEAPLP